MSPLSYHEFNVRTLETYINTYKLMHDAYEASKSLKQALLMYTYIRLNEIKFKYIKSICRHEVTKNKRRLYHV